MKQKRNKMWKRMFSMFLVVAMLITALPVTAFAKPEEKAVRVWFEYADGRIQELDGSRTFHLTTEDKGNFKAEGYNGRVGWMVVEFVSKWNKVWWAEYNSGAFQPQNKNIELKSWLEDANTESKLVEFTVDVKKAASIVEVKAFSGNQEISMDSPCQMNGSEAQTLTLKVRKDNSQEFEPLSLNNFNIEKVSGEGMILPSNGTFRVDGKEAVFKATLKSDPNVFVEFKAVAKDIALQAISVSVPKIWYIDSWNGLADYYVGIQKGDNPDNNYKISYTPSNASDKEVVWEPLTEDIATHMEAFDNGIIPKKAGVAKFKVSSKSNPEISTEVSVEFRYKYPLTAAKVEKDKYTVEEGNSQEFSIQAAPKNATEQRFHWSYSQDGIVEVKDSVSQDAVNVNTPKTTIHKIKALKAGKVTVTGKPFDETGSCKPVTFDVVVTKDGVEPQGDTLSIAKEDIAHGVKYLQGKSLEKYGNEWNIFSILRSGATIEQSKLDKYYESVVQELKKKGKTMRVTDLARVALALEAMGKNPTDVGGFNVLEAIYNHEKMMTDSSNCPIFGLLALDGRNYKIPEDAKWSRKDIITQILKFQKASGAFGLSLDNDLASIDMTGMALQSLAPYYNDPAYPDVKPAVDKALKHFKDNITVNAGFLDFGSENSCTTAQVLTAVSALNIDPTVKENGFVQNGNNMVSNLHTYKKDAGFAWQTALQAQEMATQQVTYGLIAYQRMAEGGTRLYDFTDVLDETDQKAVKEVEEKINAIGSKITLNSKKSIQEARAAYEKLSEAQKKLVSNLETLTKAEEELKKLEEASKGTVTLTVERFTIGQGYFVEPIKVPFEAGDNGATLLKKAIGAENFVGADSYLEAIKGADLGLDKVKIPEYITEISKNEVTTEAAKEYGNDSNGPEALGQFDYSRYSGWMYFVNNKAPNVGITSYQPKDGDVVRFQFTVYGYGTDLSGTTWGSTNPVVKISNKDQLTKLMAEVNADKDNLMVHDNVKNAYNAASKAISAMITPQTEIDALSKRLSEAMKNPGQPDVEDQKAAKEVEEKINAIGTEITLESKKAIEEARAAYEKLNEAQKKLVSNLETLTKAEEELKKLEEASKGTVTLTVERFTIGQGYFVEPIKVPFAAGDNGATLLKKVIGAENFVGADSYLEAIKGADLGLDKVKIPEYITEISKNEVTTEIVKEYGNDQHGLEALGEWDYSDDSKWVFFVNNEEPKVGTKLYQPKDGDVLRFQFSVYGYGTDVTGEDISGESVLAISNKDQLTKLMAEVNADKDNLMVHDNVKNAYNAASKAISAMITPQTEIDALSKRLSEAMKNPGQPDVEDQKAAKEVEEKIKAIGTEITLESKKAIEGARAAYEKLSEAQKKLVSNLETLTKAEEELKKLEEASKGTVTLTVERFTIGQGYFVEPIKVPFEAGDNGATLLKKAIGAENFVGADSYLEAIKGADLGLDKVKIPEYITEISKNEVTTEAAKEYGNDSNGPEALGQFDYSRYSGWMYFVNNKAPNVGITSYQPKDGDVVRFQFTVYGYGTDLSGTTWGSTNPVVKISNKDKLTKLMAEVNADKDNLMVHDNVKNAYNAASKAISAMITPQTEIDALSKRLSEAMKNPGQPDVEDQKAAKEVEEKIKAIGTEITLESKKAIEEARAAYEKLSEAQKKLVSNLEVLTKAEEELKKLEGQQEADQKAAKEVEEKIKAIGTEITLESKKAIEGARAAYEKLSEAQKKLVSNLEVLTKAEEELKKLEGQQEADQKAAKEVEEKIKAIGTEITLESKKAIEGARAAYEKLSEAQKKLVSNLEVLTKAEEELKKLEGQQEADQKAAKEVEEKINAIGTEITLESKKAIEEARAAYEKLSEAQKKLVSNLEVLTKAEEELKKLEGQQEADQKAAKEVEEKIKAIGTEITLESKKAIEGARAAYEKLSKVQKKLVSNLEVLTKAEEELKKLEGQQEADQKGSKRSRRKNQSNRNRDYFRK